MLKKILLLVVEFSINVGNNNVTLQYYSTETMQSSLKIDAKTIQ